MSGTEVKIMYKISEIKPYRKTAIFLPFVPLYVPNVHFQNRYKEKNQLQPILYPESNNIFFNEILSNLS